MAPKKKLHPALQENADRLKRGEPLYDRDKSKTAKTSGGSQRPKIRTRKSK